MTLDSWQQSTIGELCEMVKGSAPISKTKPGQFPLVTTGEERKTADHYQFDTTAVCVPMISSTGHGHASLKRVQYQEGKFALSNLLTALIVREQASLSPRFLHLYLNYFKDKLIVPLMAGAANMSITVGRLATVPVRFPLLEEQERILRTLDEANELRRLRAQADRRTADLIPAIFHEMFGDPVNNPKKWRVKPFGEVTQNQDGRRKPVKSDVRAHRQGQYPYYGASGIIDYVDEYIFDETALLVAEDGANLVARSTPIAFIATGKYWVNNHAHVVTEKEEAKLEYLRFSLELRSLKDFVTGSTQPKLNQARLNLIPIPLPPLSLQQQFADRVAEVRALEESQAASRERLDDLFQSLLHRAFTGEL